MAKGKFVKKIELPGCASLMPIPGVGFAALCSDGSLATVTDERRKAGDHPFHSVLLGHRRSDLRQLRL